MEYVLLFVVGLVFGSFYNVVIYRLPRNVSLITPPSSCPSCGSRIRWYDNIPLISYLILKGRCRTCGAKIPVQYPLVELGSGLLILLCYFLFGPSVDFAVYYAFFSALLILSLIDLRWFILPDVITVPGTFIGLISSPLRETVGPAESLAGVLTGAGISLGIYLYYVKFRGMEGLGLGDVKLLAFIGSATGPYGVLASLFLGSLFGLLFSLPLLLRSRNVKFAIPFGPFLSLGCFIGFIGRDTVLTFL
ncbi:MAG: prepilin peptidase, partial [Aquificota bacterium]|nr:prepilin peptidase [Aquificota bacterium]